jgi:hypothetical protein
MPVFNSTGSENGMQQSAFLFCEIHCFHHEVCNFGLAESVWRVRSPDSGDVAH